MAFTGLALAGASLVILGACFVTAGIAIGCSETAEHAAVARLAPEALRGSAFGLLPAIQSAGNLAASAVARVLWTLSPTAAFAYAAAWMLAATAVQMIEEPWAANGQLMGSPRCPFGSHRVEPPDPGTPVLAGALTTQRNPPQRPVVHL